MSYGNGYAHGCCAGCVATALVATVWARQGTLVAVLTLLLAAPIVGALGAFVLRPVIKKDLALPRAPPAELGANVWPEGYTDPLRWSFLPSSGVHYANVPRPYEREDECCSLKALVMHQPTHEPWRSETGDFPFSWHLAGRRRLWEVRLQLRFKRLPEGPLYVGIENDGPAPASGIYRRLNEMLIGAVRKTIGDVYCSPGDDPMNTEGELEPATMAVPLGAFDQFAVSEPGEEPDIASDLSEIGKRRTDGLSAYMKAMRDVTENLSTHKVYTFCFWGVSQFLDCMNWQVRMGVRIDFNRFCVQPPWYFAMYELAGPENDGTPDLRHLLSRKKYFIHVAIWSELRPPQHESLERLLDAGPGSFRMEESVAKSQRLGSCSALGALARCMCSLCARAS
mmetsp:Transcript_35628/g.82767  ORF Transcript_35628/g.82767 Transcript_35628/m.82767 type:complete len:395 (-) Transcript_35628:136-1320(-)|eukprot:CAMPEP_0171102950 /NCGR_PEP_ID=MMETSP0766_2-20121228/58648_1 /TAXON_ID=439317 /ORGANISM="Gambierdiscus australes, Strain CAWD 149" /LENGTH=394 /DNA_ID=CAMNT_0011563335 /DNA_START=41 /DNA_END=1225 /DNA_ORIENTATION=+